MPNFLQFDYVSDLVAVFACVSDVADEFAFDFVRVDWFHVRCSLRFHVRVCCAVVFNVVGVRACIRFRLHMLKLTPRLGFHTTALDFDSRFRFLFLISNPDLELLLLFCTSSPGFDSDF